MGVQLPPRALRGGKSPASGTGPTSQDERPPPERPGAPDGLDEAHSDPPDEVREPPPAPATPSVSERFSAPQRTRNRPASLIPEILPFASAAAEHGSTVTDVKRRGLAAKAATAVAVERIRGIDPEVDGDVLAAGVGGDVVVLDTPLARAADIAGRRHATASRRLTAVNPRRPLSDLLPAAVRAVELAYRPTTRALDDSNRLSVRLTGPAGKVGLTDVLGWEPGPLAVTSDGEWKVLTPDTSGAPLERHDGRCALNPDGRLRLSLAVIDGLGVRPGDELMVLVLPELGAVALCPTVALLTGAPLSLLTEPPTHCTCRERNHHDH